MTNVEETPILLLVFNRPEMTAKVFETIKDVKPQQLFIAADGPRVGRPDDVEKCRAVRDIVSQIDWDCQVETLYRDHNLGCKKAISSAINWFFDHVDRGIILEDDVLCSKSFFSFCSELLERYADDKRVMMISGDNFQDGIKRGEASYYFSRIPHIWGWATWRRAWKKFDIEMSFVEDFREKNFLDDLFLDKNIALFWKLAFSLVRRGKINTWDYPWMCTIFSQNGLSIVPNENLVSNIGFGQDSTHTTDDNSKFSSVARCELDNLMHPDLLFCNEDADLYEYTFRNAFPYKNKMGLWYRYKRLRRARRFKLKIEKAYK